MSAALRQRTLASGSSPSFYDGRQLGEVEQALLWTLLQEDPQCTSQALLDKAAERQLWVRVSLRHRNRWRAMWQLSRRTGRPPRPARLVPVRAESAVVAVTLRGSFVGVHLFARWLDQQGAFEPVVAGLKQAITVPQHAHPDDDSALWPHRESTLRRRFPALFFAPLLGIERLTACDTHEHPRATLMGSSYQSSTLSQLLGELERVEAAGALMPILSRDQAGQLTDGDGHRSASWSRKPMHKGKSTMHGRIMVGSQAVMSHDGEGQGVFVAYYPPDMHLSQLILAYGHQVAAATGSRLFVMDRAVHSQALARAFDEAGFGLLGMLDDNEHQGLESFEATEVDPLDDGTRVYQGPWKAARMAERRALVIVEPPPGKTLGVLAVLEQKPTSRCKELS